MKNTDKGKYDRFGNTLRKGHEAMLNGEVVSDLEGHKGVIEKIDPNNKEFTFLIRFENKTLKWITYKWVKFEVDKSMAS